MESDVIVGRIMMARTIALENTPKPVMVWPNEAAAPRTQATMMVKPIKPYTTEGIPTSSSMSGWNTLRPNPGAISTTKIAEPMAIGKANSVDRSITAKEPEIMGRAPTMGMPAASD